MTPGENMRSFLTLGKACLERQAQQRNIRHHFIHEVRLLASPKPNDIICIMVVRNEEMRLPDCLRHHRTIGVDRFAIIDNSSNDQTRAFLLDQPDVDCYKTSNKYSEARSGVYWHTRLARRYGFGRWYLSVDADELLVYSGMERHDLHDLLNFLESRKSKALFAPMIDMYSKEPSGSVSYEPGQSMLRACPFFDGDSYHVTKRADAIVDIKGGPRVRKLSSEASPFAHQLKKYPFFRWDRSLRRPTIHTLKLHRHEPSASGALLHFKFLADFAEKVNFAIETNEFWNGSVQYRRYRDGLATSDLDVLHYEGSREYKSPESLISAGLIGSIDWNACAAVARKARVEGEIGRSPATSQGTSLGS
jgi:hypothetical protein